MSKPTAPTPLEDATVIYNDSNGESPEAYLRLRAFLESSAVMALSDPALAAAAAVVIARLPELMEIGVLGEALIHPATNGDAVLRRIAASVWTAAQAAKAQADGEGP